MVHLFLLTIIIVARPSTAAELFSNAVNDLESLLSRFAESFACTEMHISLLIYYFRLRPCMPLYESLLYSKPLALCEGLQPDVYRPDIAA